MGEPNEEQLIDNASQAAANQWAGPVDPVLGPRPSHDGGSECHGRVHGSAGEWAAHQNVGGHYETDSDGCYHSQLTLFGVDGGGVNCVH